MRKSVRGFTIVELLIVIVVIGILATITIVAYNGIQVRAKNTQIVTAARTYYNGLVQYGATNNVYPIFSSYAICLGSGYGGNCWSGPNGTYGVLASFDTQMQDYVSPKPTVPTKYYPITSQDDRSGLIYYRNNPSGRQSIEYLLDGANQSCVLTGATSSNVAGNSATSCKLTLPAM